METHALYRFFDTGGGLLYVGITNDPGRRWGRHASDKPWWHEVDRIGIERYPDRVSVLAPELEAIKNEHPRYNVLHVVPVSVPSEPGPRPGVCECGARATVLYVLYQDIVERQESRKNWEAKQSGRLWNFTTDLLDFPAKAKWRASCDEHAAMDGGPYEFPYPTSWRDWAMRTAHLMESKRWVTDTDWDWQLHSAAFVPQEAKT
jgi:hypothetical protein